MGDSLPLSIGTHSQKETDVGPFPYTPNFNVGPCHRLAHQAGSLKKASPCPQPTPGQALGIPHGWCSCCLWGAEPPGRLPTPLPGLHLAVPVPSQASSMARRPQGKGQGVPHILSRTFCISHRAPEPQEQGTCSGLGLAGPRVTGGDESAPLEGWRCPSRAGLAVHTTVGPWGTGRSRLGQCRTGFVVGTKMHLLSHCFSGSGQPSRVRPWQPDLGVAKKARGRAVHSERGAGLLEKEEDFFLIERSRQLGPQSLSQLLCLQNRILQKTTCLLLLGRAAGLGRDRVSACGPGSRTELKGPPGTCSSILPGFFKPQWATQGGHCLEKTGGRPGHLGPDTAHSPSFPEQS